VSLNIIYIAGTPTIGASILKEEQRLLRSILTEIHSEELKKSKSNMKMKRAEKKLRALMDEEQKAQEKRGTHYFLSRWEATAVQITSKACMCHAIKTAESQARISELESLKADKELRIQQLKWQRSHLKT
jgi:Ni,Fe-hydrogenase III component G